VTEQSSVNAAPDLGDVEANWKDGKRDIVMKVRVNAAEKLEFDRQKGRLSYSAFLRDRGLNRNMVYDPTYSAIGGVYQSARNLRHCAEVLAKAGEHFDILETALTRFRGDSMGAKENPDIGMEIRDVARGILAQGVHLAELADAVGRQARELGRIHLREMLDRYPAQEVRTRKRR